MCFFVISLWFESQVIQPARIRWNEESGQVGSKWASGTPATWGLVCCSCTPASLAWSVWTYREREEEMSAKVKMIRPSTWSSVNVQGESWLPVDAWRPSPSLCPSPFFSVPLPLLSLCAPTPQATLAFGWFRYCIVCFYTCVFSFPPYKGLKYANWYVLTNKL